MIHKLEFNLNKWFHTEASKIIFIKFHLFSTELCIINKPVNTTIVQGPIAIY